MLMRSTLRKVDFDEALVLVDSGARFVDLRDVDSYLDVHIPGSLGLLYESGPGFNARARDCIPLHIPLILLDPGTVDMVAAASALRGKGFDVIGKVDDGINRWAETKGHPASTEVVTSRPEATVLHVNDPGARQGEPDIAIPIEKLWDRIDEVGQQQVAVAAGFGVRAALAVGMLEGAGHDVLFWKTRG